MNHCDNNELYKYPKHKSFIDHYPYDYPAFNRVVRNEETIEDLFFDFKKFSSVQQDDFIALFDDTHIAEYNSRLITKDNINKKLQSVIINACVTLNNNAKHDLKNLKVKYTIYDNIYCIIFINDNKIIRVAMPIIGTDSLSSSEPILKFI